MIYDDVTQLIGETPILRLGRIERHFSLNTKLLAKLEYYNPAGSVKDRVALSLIQDAEASGTLKPGGTIIEPTSGNTGIGLASIAAARGYKVILVMPESMSVERRMLLKAYGAELVLTDKSTGMSGAVEKAEALAKEIEGSFMPSQFENPANPLAHIKTTGPEILRDTNGDIAALVACVGTGGTVTGLGTYLKENINGVKVFAVEPDRSPILSGGQAGPHGIQGIGANFVPKILDTSVYDEVIRVTDEDAYEIGRLIAKSEGVLVGQSSGAALSAAIKISGRSEFANKNILVILPDTGERYLSSPMFN